MDNEWKIGNLFAAAGEKIKGHLEMPTLSERLPVFLINGSQEGPSVLVMAGIHGCEYTSIDAALKIGASLNPKNMNGRVVVVPIANPSSFYARSIYVHPADHKNLNRIFPGQQHGTEAERLAYWLNEMVFKQVDYVIDLHGGDMIEALVPFTIYHKTEDEQVLQVSKKMASLFDIEYVIGSGEQVPGSTYSCAAEQGIPSIIAEAGQQGILSTEQSQMLQEGVRNILASFDIVEGDPASEDSTYLSVFDWYRSELQCLWYPEIGIGERVEAGQLLGRLTDEFGETIREVHSNSAGIVLFLVSSLAINENDPLLAVGA